MSESRRPGYALVIAAIVIAVVALGFAFRSSGGESSNGKAASDTSIPSKSGADSSSGTTPPARSVRAKGERGASLLTVAFIGDQGRGEDATAVLELIRAEGADMVLHQGDFDYHDDPVAWDQKIDDTLGPTFPYFASVGNHDVNAWSAYQNLLQERLDRVDGARCKGDLGVNSSCRYRGLFFVLSGVGTMGSGHERYMRKALKRDRSAWRICSWHKNQAATQIGGKGNSAGWRAYEICRRHGAIIATAHEHSYERTLTLRDVNTAEVDRSCADDPATPDPDVCVGRGSTFLFVSGLGGISIRDQQRCLPVTYPYGCNGEWAKIYAADQGAQFGALFITFDTTDEARAASGYFKTIDGEVVDSFTITRR